MKNLHIGLRHKKTRRKEITSSKEFVSILYRLLKSFFAKTNLLLKLRYLSYSYFLHLKKLYRVFPEQHEQAQQEKEEQL